MSDATLIAAELQDLAATVEQIGQALRERPEPNVIVNVPELAPPPITVNVPEVVPQVTVNVPEAPPPQVMVEAPEVTVQSHVLVPPPKPNAYEVRITDRDDNGFISRFVITPMHA